MNRNPITASLADPYQLELLYRENPDHFVRWFREAIRMHPRAHLLLYWQARLQFRPEPDADAPWIGGGQLTRLLLLCVLAFLLVKLPWILSLDEVWYLPRVAPAAVVLALCLFLARVEEPLRQTLGIPALGLGLLSFSLLMLPDLRQSDSVIMALLHSPILAWCLLGYAHAAGHWQDTGRRLEYLRYNGELLILTVLILLGGGVLTGLTLELFALIGLDIVDWYARNVILAGAVSAPLVATFLYEVIFHRQSRFATTIANLFTPLFLVTVVAFLLAMAVARKSPYTDRDFLILFNGLLILVLGMTLFSISGRDPDRPSRLTDLVSAGLLVVTLLVNAVALSAIAYRLAEWGATPNRVVVIGVNLLVFIHLMLIALAYLRNWRQRGYGGDLARITTGYLPVYGAWAMVVILVLPWVFSYR